MKSKHLPFGSSRLAIWQIFKLLNNLDQTQITKAKSRLGMNQHHDEARRNEVSSDMRLQKSYVGI